MINIRRQIPHYFRLMRLDKPIGILLLLWPTLWALWIAAQGVPPLKILIIFGTCPNCAANAMGIPQVKATPNHN